MDYEITTPPGKNYVHIKVYETITPDLERSFASEAIKQAKAHNRMHYFTDVTGVRNVSDPADMYKLAYQELAAMGMDRRSKIAILVSADDHSHDFIETVFVNAGYLCLLFHDPDHALAWLED
jgi:hypothetical protein